MRNALVLAACLPALLAASPASARVAKGPWVQRLGPTSAEIRVEVDPPAPVTLEVGLTAAALPDGGSPRVVESKETKAFHAIPIAGLEPATRYPYTVRTKGEATNGAFTTAPREGTDTFKFLIYGDNRSDDVAHAAVVKAMTGSPSDFLVNTGDFVEDGASSHDWQTFFDIEAPLLRERCVFACIGNHELTDGSGANFARYFGSGDPGGAPMMMEPSRRVLDPKQLDHTFRWANARFFLVNGMVPYRTGPDRAWLEKALADADGEAGVDWRIVVLHHGPWSSGPHGDNLGLLDAGIPQLLRSRKVDLVLSGHDHIYERGIVDGMPYVVSGGGGAPPYRVKNAKPFAKKLESVRHFIEASVSPAGIALKVVRVDGSTLERCGLKKDGWDCDGDKKPATIAPGPSSPPPSAPTSPESPTSAPAGSSRCACRAVGGELPSGVLPWLVAFGAATLLLRRRS